MQQTPLAPLVGLITDRVGHRATVGIGIVVFGVSLTVGAVSPERPAAVVASLILLGVGWSFVNVAGSALFSQVVPDENRATAQGGVDALSNLCGAVAAFASGPLMALTSFRLLCIIAMVVLVPLIIVTVTQSDEKTAQGFRSDG